MSDTMTIYWADLDGQHHQAEAPIEAVQVAVGVRCPFGCGQISAVDWNDRQFTCTDKADPHALPAVTFSIRDNKIVVRS